ncbi:MAG: site-specific DNA-methyltransferase [Acidobacteriota bacterium]|nr:site-specific DNA-methyltransferase [Acidobacteriota bacterium]
MLHPFGSLVSDVWTDIHRVKHNKYRDEHPCQLPIHLLERIILMSTDEGDIVLDPFSGTGTTAIAAKRLGRNFIGFEKDKLYAEISENKLSQEEPNSKIGDIWVSFFLNKAVTIRDKDWENLAVNYLIPEPIEKIDHTRIIHKETTLPKTSASVMGANQNKMPSFQKEPNN